MTSIVTKSFENLTIAFNLLNDASELCSNPTRQAVCLRNNNVIHSAVNAEHLYLGVRFMTSNNLVQHIRYNLLRRALTIG